MCKSILEYLRGVSMVRYKCAATDSCYFGSDHPNGGRGGVCRVAIVTAYIPRRPQLVWYLCVWAGYLISLTRVWLNGFHWLGRTEGSAASRPPPGWRTDIDVEQTHFGRESSHMPWYRQIKNTFKGELSDLFLGTAPQSSAIIEVHNVFHFQLSDESLQQ